jgi:8-oxo-dGTP pyrophosphatase MutT (NUDIX family)
VLVPDDEGRACLLLTRRVPKLRAHGGQWALPGGRIDAGESAEAAALRELFEEVDLTRGPDAILGLLDDYPTRSGFVITPVVVWGGSHVPLTANPDEVASIHRVPLTELDKPDVPRLISIPESTRPVIQLPLLGTLIHAPTAAVVFQAREVVVHGLSRWCSNWWRNFSNQNRERAVRILPLSGMPLGITTSYAEIRSVATINSLSPRS